MLIRNLKRPQDRAKKLETFEELVALQVENENNITNARRAVAKGEVDPTQIRDGRTKEEKLLDATEQKQEAIRNLQRLGFDFNEASDIVNDIGNDFYYINMSYPILKESFSKVFNVETITPSFFVMWYKDWTQRLVESKGITWGNSLNLTNDYKYLIQNMPLKNDFLKLKAKYKSTNAFLAQKLQEIADAMPTEEDLKKLQANTPEALEARKALLEATEKIPTSEELSQMDETEIEKVISSLDAENILRLRQIRQRLRELRGIPETDKNSQEPLSLDEFKQLSPTTKKYSYITTLRDNGLLKPEEITVLHNDTSKNYNNYYKSIIPTVLERYKGLKLDVLSTIKRNVGRASKVQVAPPGPSGSKQGKGIKIGRGIQYEKRERYVPFGKLVLNQDLLENNDILKVLYQSKGPHPSFRDSMPVSDVFRDFLMDLLENQKMNNTLYKNIEPQEKIIFEKMVSYGGLSHIFPLKKVHIDHQKELMNRFEVLKGQLEAGNNNEKLKREFKNVCILLYKDGRMKKNDFLQSLLIV